MPGRFEGSAFGCGVLCGGIDGLSAQRIAFQKKCVACAIVSRCERGCGGRAAGTSAGQRPRTFNCEQAVSHAKPALPYGKGLSRGGQTTGKLPASAIPMVWERSQATDCSEASGRRTCDRNRLSAAPIVRKFSRAIDKLNPPLTVPRTTSASSSSWPSSCHQQTGQSPCASGWSSVWNPQQRQRVRSSAGITLKTQSQNQSCSLILRCCLHPSRQHPRRRGFLECCAHSPLFARSEHLQSHMPGCRLARLQRDHAGVHPVPYLAEGIAEIVLLLHSDKLLGWRRVHLHGLDLW